MRKALLSTPFLLVAILGLFYSCEQAAEEVAVSSVTISQPSAEMIIGETIQLKAIITPSNATEKDVIWASSKQSVATVNQEGLVTALTEGSTTVSASAGGKYGSCVVSVANRTVIVNSISLSPKSLQLYVGGEQQINVTVDPDEAKSMIKWQSGDNVIASVDNNGKVSAISVGETWISAKAGEVEAKCPVTVTAKPIAAEAITISPSELKLNIGDSSTLTITFTPENTTSQTITWSTSNNNIVSVSQQGVITAQNSGTATITARHEDLTSTCNVTVNSLANNEIIYKTKDNTVLVNSELSQEFANDIVSITYSGEQGKIVLNKNITKINREAFSNCTRLVRIILPNGITTIGESAFAGCTGLSSVTLPSNLVTIEKEAFRSTLALKQITIPDTVTTIGESAFSGTGLTHISLPNKLTKISNRCFASFYLNSISIPNSVTEIGVWAFYGCPLKTVTLPSKLTLIGEYAFGACTELTSITLPESLKSIGGNAFVNCAKLTSINIPKSVTTIGTGVFSGCHNLASFNSPYASADNRCIIINGELLAFAPGNLSEYTIPSNVRRIGAYSFAYCKLIGIILPEGVTEIGKESFSECPNIRVMTLPSSVTLIEEEAFYKCGEKKMTSITIKAVTPPKLDGYLIFSDTNYCPIYVPKNSVDIYKTTSGWYSYANRIKAIE